MPQQEGGNGAPGLPPTVHERANPPPERRAYPTIPQKSTLNRAVEGTRNLYERNGWTLVPLFKYPEDPAVRIIREAAKRRGEKLEDIVPLILEDLKRFDDSNPKYAEFIRYDPPQELWNHPRKMCFIATQQKGEYRVNFVGLKSTLTYDGCVMAVERILAQAFTRRS